MKQKITILTNGLLIIILAILAGCNNTTNGLKTKIVSAHKAGLPISSEVSNLLSVNCYACHNPNTKSHDEMLAPPLAGIKIRYKKATKNREAFIDLMSSFVYNPSEEASLMKGSIKRFGVMPKTALDENKIREIVTYLYDNDVPEPSWFKEHHNEMNGGKNNKK